MPPPLEYARPIFEERQTMKLGPLWNVFAVIVAVIAVTAVIVLFRISHNPLARAAACMILIPAVLTFTLPRVILRQLVTRVDGEGVHVRFGTFPWTHFRTAEIAWIEVRTYDARKEFGGYGLRLRQSGGRGDCYTLAGDRGVRLALRDGRKVLVGSKKAEDLAAAVRSLFPSESPTPPA